MWDQFVQTYDTSVYRAFLLNDIPVCQPLVTYRIHTARPSPVQGVRAPFWPSGAFGGTSSPGGIGEVMQSDKVCNVMGLEDFVTPMLPHAKC